MAQSSKEASAGDTVAGAPLSRAQFDALVRANPEYVDELYQAFRENPDSVGPAWQQLFAGYDYGLSASPVSVGKHGEQVLGVYHMIHSYRQFGHLVADIDPLSPPPQEHPLLRLETFGLTNADLDREVSANRVRGLQGMVKLRELREHLRETYCGPIGAEFVFIRDTEQWDWLLARMEPTRNRPVLDAQQRQEIFQQLAEAEAFERFLHAKYRGAKRFSLEGGESMVPLVNEVIEEAARHGADEIVLGMPHRGRLNVLANIMRKPYEFTLAEFEGMSLPQDVQGAGDVKYHKGYSSDRQTRAGRQVHLSLSPNPSHLEAINPVVEGMVWAKQDYKGDREKRRVVPVLMHGDAAFAGQGIVYETLLLSKLDGFEVGGTIHIVINNQVGFTADPEEARSTYYATDVARALRAPVFHVNADDPEAVVHVARLATAYRQTFGIDVFIDLMCYRRHGHNEIDDPTFTQPVLYRKIKSHPSVVDRYEQQLLDAGVISKADLDGHRQNKRDRLDRALETARDELPESEDVAFRGRWEGLDWASGGWHAETAVDDDTLKHAAANLAKFPESFTPHPRLPRNFEQMRKLVDRGEGLHWAIGELLAYATLLQEGTPVRLVGQDSERGTFSHRHAVLHDYETGEIYVPLNHVAAEQEKIQIVNSPLSEAAVLGFEYGISSADPWRLVIWEAQFGDFANGGQVIIDQFLASGESKWQKQSGLVLLLPHGYEGQGPEHSSARAERFLQLCAHGNMQVVNCTTPAQFFHVLRRQMHRNFRKPLVVLTPKSLLRHKMAVSSLSEFTEHGFRTVIPDPHRTNPDKIRRVLLCQGKVYYTLHAVREEMDPDQQVAIVRLEQLYPFPDHVLRQVLAEYDESVEVCWVQEEPRNQGAWHFVLEALHALLGWDRPLYYIGRPELPSPATGIYEEHRREEQEIIAQAFQRPGEGIGRAAIHPVSPSSA